MGRQPAPIRSDTFDIITYPYYLPARSGPAGVCRPLEFNFDRPGVQHPGIHALAGIKVYHTDALPFAPLGLGFAPGRDA